MGSYILLFLQSDYSQTSIYAILYAIVYIFQNV